MNKLDIIKALVSEGGCAPEVGGDTEYGGSEIKIVILQRGWVFVGRFSKAGSVCKLTDASNIRTWGTTKGLGELCDSGPKDSTKLDKVKDVMFHELSIVALLDCDDKIWKKSL